MAQARHQVHHRALSAEQHLVAADKSATFESQSSTLRKVGLILRLNLDASLCELSWLLVLLQASSVSVRVANAVEQAGLVLLRHCTARALRSQRRTQWHLCLEATPRRPRGTSSQSVLGLAFSDMLGAPHSSTVLSAR